MGRAGVFLALEVVFLRDLQNRAFNYVVIG